LRGVLPMSDAVRKVRSDKKRDVKPTVHASTYELVSRISYITNTPMKDVAEVFCYYGLYSLKVIELFELKFRRSYIFANSRFPKFFPGDDNQIGQRAIKEPGTRKRVTIRFDQEIHDKLAEFAYALDVTVSSATAMLLEASIKETDILNEYLKRYIDNNLDSKRKKQLEEVLEHISRNNPYDNEVTYRSLLGQLLGEVWDYGRSFKKVVEEWLDQVTEDDGK
jgi:antitoxin component of RelBE/YafQ-DinJ toxin-antitoxin module